MSPLAMVLALLGAAVVMFALNRSRMDVVAVITMVALISGMMTLVATAPNLVVHSELMRQGLDGFSFFAFTPFGVPILVLAILYMLLARRFLAPGPAPELPERAALTGWVADYGLAGREHRLQLRAGINIIAIESGSRFRRKLIQPRAETALEAGDILLIDRRTNGTSGYDLDAFAQAHDLIALPVSGQWFTDTAQEIGMAQIIVPPTSRLIGKTVTQARFRSTHDLSVIGMKHGTKPVSERVIDEPLRPGDTLLTVGPWRAIRKLADERRDLILLDLPAEADEAVPARHRAPLAIGVLALVVVLMVWGIVPNVQAALFGCLLLGLFRCIDMAGAYRSIQRFDCGSVASHVEATPALPWRTLIWPRATRRHCPPRKALSGGGEWREGARSGRLPRAESRPKAAAHRRAAPTARRLGCWGRNAHILCGLGQYKAQ